MQIIFIVYNSLVGIERFESWMLPLEAKMYQLSYMVFNTYIDLILCNFVNKFKRQQINICN